MKTYRNIALTLVCILLGVILSWQFRSINDNQKMSGLENKRVEDLKTELLQEKKAREELEKRNQELANTNSKFENAKTDEDQYTATLKEQLKTAKILAGMVDVKGKGIVVTLNTKGMIYVDDTNVLDLINELRASDARAISVNDERIVAMSEVREAGKYIMVNSKRLSAPYVVKAIGDQDKLVSSLKMTGGMVEKLQDLISINIEKIDNITIPKVRDDGTVLKTDQMTPVN